jgi:membrane fusion protein (multidrug efflux system)
MKLRMLLMLVAVGKLVVVLGAVKYKQVSTAMAQQSSFQPPPEAVTTIVAREEPWPATIGAIGTVAAVRGVTISADLPGVIEKIAFESGMAVKEGDILALLDTRTERAQLAAAEAARDLAKANLERSRGLRQEQIIAEADFDRADAEFRRAEASTHEIRAAIGRKTILAPFSGVLGIRQANLGQYLAGGAPIVTLQTLDPVYVNFAVPQQQLARIRPGSEIRVVVAERQLDAAGKVTAIDSVIDEATRNVQVQATLANRTGQLRPGMFVQVSAKLGAGSAAVTLPASSISYAPYGDSVFVVTTMKGPDGRSYQGVVQRFVKLGQSRGDQVAVLSGVSAGDEVVTSGVFKLRNGAAVRVNNAVQPSNKPSPRPEEG